MNNTESEIKSAMQNLPLFDITDAQKSSIIEAARAFDTKRAKKNRLLTVRTFLAERKKLSLAIAVAAALILFIFLLPENSDSDVNNIYASQTRALREYPSSIVEWRNGKAIITTTPTRFDARFKSVPIALEVSKYFDDTPKIFVIKHEIENKKSNRDLHQ